MSSHVSIADQPPFPGSVKLWWSVVAAATLALVAVAPAVAHASPPVHQPPANATYDIHLAEGDVPCGPVTITLTDGQRYTTFSTGVVLATGQLRAVVTSGTTGKSVSLNVSGPGKIFPENSVSGGGLSLLFGSDVLAYTAGRISIPPNFDVNAATVKGRWVDLCPLLGF